MTRSAHWLSLAAAPTFALMTWVAAVDAPGIPICSSASGVLPVDAMAWMYMLMSLFHLPPWLKRASPRGPAPTPTDTPSRKTY